MGINGLIPALKPILKSIHISEVRGKRVAVDGYCWLHKGAYSCCKEICNGEITDRWIKFCLNLIDLLLAHDMKVTIIFDGANLPAKAQTEGDRNTKRKANLASARECELRGDHSAARQFYSRSVDITPIMAAQLIQIIKENRPGVECIVAPFEADAQLAYLCRNNLVDIIITEDSDSIPYGCKDILFKLEPTGSCDRLIVPEMYTTYVDKFDLRTFNPTMFLIMCIISGCDYLGSLSGIGLKTSHKLILKHQTAANLLKHLRLQTMIPIHPATEIFPDDSTKQITNMMKYEWEFYKAYTTFHHHIVFDPIQRKTVNLLPIQSDSLHESMLSTFTQYSQYAPDILELPFLGSHIETTIACGIADGLVDPCTMEPFVFPSSIPRPVSANNSITRTSTTPATSHGSYVKSQNVTILNKLSPSSTFQKPSTLVRGKTTPVMKNSISTFFSATKQVPNGASTTATGSTTATSRDIGMMPTEATNSSANSKFTNTTATTVHPSTSFASFSYAVDTVQKDVSYSSFAAPSSFHTSMKASTVTTPSTAGKTTHPSTSSSDSSVSNTSFTTLLDTPPSATQHMLYHPQYDVDESIDRLTVLSHSNNSPTAVKTSPSGAVPPSFSTLQRQDSIPGLDSLHVYDAFNISLDKTEGMRMQDSKKKQPSEVIDIYDISEEELKLPFTITTLSPKSSTISSTQTTIESYNSSMPSPQRISVASVLGKKKEIVTKTSQDSIKQLQMLQMERAKNALADLENQETQVDVTFVPSSWKDKQRKGSEVIELDGTDDEADVTSSPPGPFTITNTISPYEDSLAPPMQRSDIFSRFVFPKDSNKMMGSTKTTSVVSSIASSSAQLVEDTTPQTKSEKSYFIDTRKASATVDASQRDSKRSRTKSTDKNPTVTGNAFASNTVHTTSNPFERFGFTVFK